MPEKATPEIRLCVFLGNPGKEHEATRHNAAWLALAHLPFYDSLVFQDKFKGRFSLSAPKGPSILLPKTYMNLSGDSVAACMSFYKLLPSQLIVVHDDTELPFGTAGFRFGGGLGGHNGLRSIKQNLATEDFWRFRLGIGRPSRGDLHGHVLGRFSLAEEAQLGDYFSKAMEIFTKCIADPDKAAKEYGKIVLIERNSFIGRKLNF